VILLLRYNLRQLGVRRGNTLATLASVALVVGVFCYLLSFAEGLRTTLGVTADPHNLVVLAEGATAESNSAVTHDDAARLATLPHLALDATGRPLVSPEVVVQTNVTRRGDEHAAFAGVAVRGVDLEVALSVHPAITLTEGRWFRSGLDELVVGGAAGRRFVQGTLGERIECGNSTFTVVGTFSAAGGAHESEFWGYVSNVAAAYRRDMYSCAVVRLNSTDGFAVQEAVDRVTSSSIALRAAGEGEYFAGQTENARIIRNMALVIVMVMGIGAVFAAMNALHSALSGRTREIGMLRALGYSRRALMVGLVAESIAAAVAGGVLGCGAAAIFILYDGGSRDLVGTTTFTSVAFTFRVRAAQVVFSLLVACAIGVFGGLWPAYRALRKPVVEALRTA